ncbi:MAG: hypothetical protein LBQ93_04245 [Treponema sp.]|jgi:hypothetical protein|nr:hypothetical protein [Treponema sp.]
MKNFQKAILVCVVILFCATSPAFSQNTTIKIEDLQKNADDFLDSLAKSLPFNSTIGLNWSDAYIGKMPPHFGIGISAGFTTMDYASLGNLMNQFDLNMSFNKASTFEKAGLPIPGYTIEARIGGIKIPFDFGIKFGYIPAGVFESMLEKFSNKPDFGYQNMLIGADIRFSPLDKKVFPVKLSVGLGFNYMKGEITAALPDTMSYSFSNSGNDYEISQTAGQLGIEWRTSTLELKTQVSFPLKFFTPYAGVGISYAFSQAGYRVNSKISVKKNGSPASIEDVEGTLKSMGITGVSDTGFETIKKIPRLNSRAFGGFSFNLAFFRLDLTGMYNIIGGDFGITLGSRFQL